MGKRSSNGRRSYGFSSPVQRQLWGPILRSAGIRHSEKRQFLNGVGSAMMFGAALFGAVAGYSILGIVGATLGLGVGGAAVGIWLSSNRYTR